jgi:hypothetical protein
MSNLNGVYHKIARQLTSILQHVMSLSAEATSGYLLKLPRSQAPACLPNMTHLKLYTETVERLKNRKKGGFMTIYEELITRVRQGETFNIDFKKRTMKVGKDYLIKDGEYSREEKATSIRNINLNEVLQNIEQIYKLYKYSLPSERSESKRRKYFKALSFDELKDDELFVADRRDEIQAQLEGYVLISILNGNLYWDEKVMGKWFWQSKKDPDLVVLRDWIEK